MKINQIIKSNGFTTKRIENIHKGIFGGKCNHVIALVNSNNEILHFENKPYFPCGKINAFASLIKSGDINSKCFSWHKISTFLN